MFDDKYYMNLALELAKTGIGYTSPNPCVGAVIVQNNKIVGTGAHLKAGAAHAEVNALNMAGNNTVGSTLYVTLEPCNHYGRTPPCTQAIINSGISKVVVATPDPNPLVSGNGITTLEQAGIAVEVGLLHEEATQLNQIFFHYITHKKPFITLKCGMSLDAKLATKTFESKWITNANSRLDAHSYRHTHDAILVGINTVLADDPSLTYRGELKFTDKKPLIRIILDTQLRTPLISTIIKDTLSPTWIVVGNQVTKEQIEQYSYYNHVKIIQMPDQHIDLNKLMQQLGQLEVTSLLVEGGYTILTAFLELGLFNQIITYIAPLLIGGESAPNLFMGNGFNGLNDAIKLKYEQVQMIDNDLKLILKPA